jgi:hypothetical protein
MFDIRERAVMGIRKMDDLKAVELFRKTFEPVLNSLKRKAVRLIDGVFGDLRQIPGKLAKRFVR